jgi:predicted fused transcriptional regulator/phosphomethylpyrimidine kinase/DNA-binding XRE family transcriptional regulator
MKPPCYLLIDKIFPVVKILAAKSLYEKYGKTQKEIAKGLSVSQSMVSKYLKEERVFDEEILKISKKIAKKLAFALKEELSEAEILEFLCTTCFELRKDKELCELHDIPNCNVCLNLYTKNFYERNEVIKNIEKAAELLEEMSLGLLVPEVRINIAMAVKNPKSYLEIAALPGRMIEIKGKLKRVSDPEFGASKHMSGILFNVMKKYSKKRAVLNLRYDKNFKEVLESLFNIFYIKRKTGEGGLKKIIEKEYNGEDCIVDPGAFGIEPCIYVLGETAVEAVRKVREINKKITEM